MPTSGLNLFVRFKVKASFENSNIPLYLIKNNDERYTVSKLKSSLEFKRIFHSRSENDK